jgi:SAM-dependent methyltransferase
MGLLVYDALVLAKVAAQIPGAKRVLTLGVPTLNFAAEHFDIELASRPDMAALGLSDWNVTNHVEFFRRLGFEEVDALDISGYEGATIIGDLNDPALADSIGRSYDLIYDSGTIEHIFDAPTALRSIARMLKVGGAVVHATPANGFMDHGFWQCSPDLFKAFYRASGFSIATSALLVLGPNVHARRADENYYRSCGRRYIVENFAEAISVFAAIKQADQPISAIRLQDYYASMHEGFAAGDASSFFIEFGTPAAKSRDGANGGLMRRLAVLRRVIFDRHA